MIEPTLKASIDAMSIEEMVRRSRYAPAGDPMFDGETGEYFRHVLTAKRARLAPGEYTEICHQVDTEKSR